MKTLDQVIQAETDQCLCGCGAEVADGKKFLPGHDAKAIHDIIHRYYGDIESFVDAHHAGTAKAPPKRLKSGTMKKVG